MLTLSPGSSCDVCAEEYGRQTVPHSIPCGHVLCYACCSAIVEKTPSRLQPSCPFCREHFTIEGVRLIHIDLPNNGSSSGWSTPKKFPCVEANPLDNVAAEGWPTKLTALPDAGLRTSNAEVRRLENKVHSVANRKCSVEEVKTLKDELEVWLSAVKTNDQTSISLSAALLRAILMNHMAHSEASRNAKTMESNLKADLDDMQLKVEKLEAEVRRSRLELTQKTHECQTLRSEVARHGGSYSLPASPPDSRVTSPIPGIPSPPPSTSTSPTPYSTPNAVRYPSVHSRSTSASIASRSATPSPSAPTRMYTPAPRSHTPNPTSSSSHYLSNSTSSSSSHARSQSIRRAQTPVSSASAAASSASASAAAVPPVPSVPVPPRMTTPAPNPNYMARAQTPGLSSSSASASTSSRSRRMSTSQSPKQMARSSSDETHQHQRWIPPSTVSAEPDGHHRGYTSQPVSRTSSSGQSGAFARVRA